MTAPPTIVATISGPDALHAALRSQAERINRSRLEIDSLAGFTSGYVSKLLSPSPQKKLSLESLFQLVSGLGLDLALVSNAEHLARIMSRSPPREPNRANHAGAVHLVFSMKHLRKLAKKGGQNSRKYMSRREAKMLARRAAAARWSKELSP